VISSKLGIIIQNGNVILLEGIHHSFIQRLPSDKIPKTTPKKGNSTGLSISFLGRLFKLILAQTASQPLCEALIIVFVPRKTPVKLDESRSTKIVHLKHNMSLLPRSKRQSRSIICGKLQLGGQNQRRNRPICQ
jgi:hypothetical protein